MCNQVGRDFIFQNPADSRGENHYENDSWCRGPYNGDVVWNFI
jgi:hypothetical protein